VLFLIVLIFSFVLGKQQQVGLVDCLELSPLLKLVPQWIFIHFLRFFGLVFGCNCYHVFWFIRLTFSWSPVIHRLAQSSVITFQWYAISLLSLYALNTAQIRPCLVL
jgi:hypothetical protein